MLGRGLEALIPAGENDANNKVSVDGKHAPESSVSHPKPVESVFQIEVERIKPNPHQPRRDFDEAALKELALSVREFGVLQPLIVTKVEKESDEGTTVEYELIAGERRLLAAKMAGLRTVPAIIRRITPEHEKLELAIIENVQRLDLNPIEEARAYARLQDEFKLTQREIASKLGKSREAIANAVRLLNLPSEIQDAVASGKINESQARLLLSVDDISRQRELFTVLIRDNMSVRELKAKVAAVKTGASPPSSNAAPIDPELAAMKEQLEEFLGTDVVLSRSGPSGHLTINFYSPEELHGIIGKIIKKDDSSSSFRESGIQSP
jgi:ParB family chromosome partitioning protein